MGLTREKAKALRMTGDANNISTVFRLFVLNCNIFCGGTITVFWTSNGQKEDRISVSIWSSKEVTSLDDHGFPYHERRDSR